MEFAYRYSGTTPKGATVSGVVYSANADDAYYKIQALLKLTPRAIELCLWQTLAAWCQAGVPARDLIRLYRTLAERRRIGRSIPQGLQDAMEYVDDRRFVSALALMQQSMYDGMKFSDAMERAGFPLTDVEAVRAVQVAGKEGEVLLGLAEHRELAEEIRRKMGAILWYPLTLALLAWGIAWWMVLFIAPKVGMFFRQASVLEGALPGWAQAYYDAATVLSEHAGLATLAWLALPAGVFLAARSVWAKRLLDRISAFHALSMKADLVHLWSSVGVLFAAGVKPAKLFGSLVAVARRADNAERLREMASIYRAGNCSLARAVTQVNFPRYVQAEISAAESSNSLTEGIRTLVALLRQDLSRHLEQAQRVVLLGSYGVIALFVLGFFAITLYPQMAATLSRL